MPVEVASQEKTIGSGIWTNLKSSDLVGYVDIGGGARQGRQAWESIQEEPKAKRWQSKGPT